MMVFLFVCIAQLSASSNKPLPLVPYPQSVTTLNGEFDLLKNKKIYISKHSSGNVAKLASDLANKLSASTNTKFSVRHQTQPKSGILLQVASTGRKAESYKLTVSPQLVSITAEDEAGLFYGIQTFLQLFPRHIIAGIPNNSQEITPIACVEIQDSPRFQWRGFMLDEGRHFFGKEAVKRVLDIMSIYKMNRFHWHLTEDQGWRIEIKKYPRLTEVGSLREYTVQWKDGKELSPDNTPYGPFFYTQDDIREIVAYAKDKFIEIVPEIDMPGHFQAAMAAYPEFSCTPNKEHKVWTRFGISRDVLNVANPKAVAFAKDILDEITELFPFEYIHIGGDECPTFAWENNQECKDLLQKLGSTNFHDLQTHFYEQIHKHLSGKADISKQRKIIAWNETLSGNTDNLELTIMSWIRADRDALKAAKKGLDVILTPQIPYYINRRQSPLPTEPNTQGKGTETLQAVYNYAPAHNVPEEILHHYKGVQANFWTEHVTNPHTLEYLLLPRLAAVAEAAWTPQEVRNYENFVLRLSPDQILYSLKGYPYGRHAFE